ncbi:MAG: hypothetical protein JSU07_11165 [Bacteroidetes bacterium]|nr:hypothetical protein [Bacteroidota bacterium]
MSNLFSEFKAVNADEWKLKLEKDLKGISFDKLSHTDEDGINTLPFYTQEDLKKSNTSIFSHNCWDICEHIDVQDEVSANKIAINALNNGASGLVFHVSKKVNQKVLLKGISIEHIYVQFNISYNAINLISDLSSNINFKNPFENTHKCFVCIDPIYLAALDGKWQTNENEDLKLIKELNYISANATLYKNAGASITNEIAITLAHLNEYLNYLKHEDLLSGTHKKTIHLTCAVGSNFFKEIAKIRAYRLLIDFLQKQYKLSLNIHIHTTNAIIDNTTADAYNNLLRSTTQAMSAIIGGANSIEINPFNISYESTTEFSSRMARNQLLILKNESYFDKVSDPANGSYYIENLTHQLAKNAWEKFKLLEEEGGFLNCLKNNFIQNILKQDVSLKISSLKENKKIILGVNKHKNIKENVQGNKKAERLKDGKEFERIVPINLETLFEKEIIEK